MSAAVEATAGPRRFPEVRRCRSQTRSWAVTLHQQSAGLYVVSGTPQVVPYKNKQRVLVFSTRGITARYRHLMEDLRRLIPHHKKDVKVLPTTPCAPHPHYPLSLPLSLPRTSPSMHLQTVVLPLPLCSSTLLFLSLYRDADKLSRNQRPSSFVCSYSLFLLPLPSTHALLPCLSLPRCSWTPRTS